MSAPNPSRSVALDALRGIAILGMGLSGRLPWGTLPAYMYHAQTPPPSMALNANVAGITWVDLVFPFFLFSMGAAMPFALGKRLERGDASWRVILDVLKRGVLLGLFAIVAMHFRPESIDSPQKWLLGVGLFFAMVLAWGAWPTQWNVWVGRGLNAVGIGACGYAGVTLRFTNGGDWNWGRSDIILLVLANVAVSGGLIWMATRNHPGVRLWVIAAMSGLFLAHEQPGWVQQFWAMSPSPSHVQWEFHKYLLLVLPGTLVGDWLRAHRDERPNWAGIDRFFTIFAGLGLSVVTCHYLLQRDVVTSFGLCLPLLLIGGCSVLSQKRFWSIGALGAGLLLFGHMVEPIGGGIKKDPSTFSYFFLTAGLACWMLLAFMAMEPKVRREKPAENLDEPTKPVKAFPNPLLSYLAGAGCNPMIAYIGITNLIPGLVRESGIHGWAGGQPWDPWGFAGYGLAQTIAVGLAAIIFTRLRIAMRT